MKYIVLLKNENDFNKKLRALKKYCMKAYKHFNFEFMGKKLFDKKNGNYIYNLPTSSEFKFVYGQIRLKYKIIDKTIIIEDLEPSQFFLDGYSFDLNTYKGLFYRNDKDKFKIDLINEIKKGR